MLPALGEFLFEPWRIDLETQVKLGMQKLNLPRASMLEISFRVENFPMSLVS